MLALIAEHGGSVEDKPVAIETDKNLLVVAAAEAGFTVYPINPRAVVRYRERHGQAGRKSDPGDAAVLAYILRTDRHMHRPLPALSHAFFTRAQEAAAPGRDHRRVVQERTHPPPRTLARRQPRRVRHRRMGPLAQHRRPHEYLDDFTPRPSRNSTTITGTPRQKQGDSTKPVSGHSGWAKGIH